MTDPEETLLPLTRRTLLKTSLPVLAGVTMGVGCGGAHLPTTTVSAGTANAYEIDAPQRLAEYDVFIIRTDAGIAAVSGRCPHRGCGVAPLTEGGFECDCHGSLFTADGTVTQGPAEEDLTWYAVRVDGGEVSVDPRTIVPKGTFTPA